MLHSPAAFRVDLNRPSPGQGQRVASSHPGITGGARALSQLNAETLFFGNKLNLVLASQPAQRKIQEFAFAVQFFLELCHRERSPGGKRLPDFTRSQADLLLNFSNFRHFYVPPYFQNLWLVLVDDSINPAMQDFQWN